MKPAPTKSEGMISTSHPTWVRGLKPKGTLCIVTEIQSHPTWVRGLKLVGGGRHGGQRVSHPTWVRGLKLRTGASNPPPHPSHPTWVRGLKLSFDKVGSFLPVAPYVGAWIETVTNSFACIGAKVAPYVGAWIETAHGICFTTTFLSHPTWVRGLKLEKDLCSIIERWVAPYVGAWIETI